MASPNEPSLEQALRRIFGMSCQPDILSAVTELSQHFCFWARKLFESDENQVAQVCAPAANTQIRHSEGGGPLPNVEYRTRELALQRLASTSFWLSFALKSYYVPLDIDAGENETRGGSEEKGTSEWGEAYLNCTGNLESGTSTIEAWLSRGDSFEDAWGRPCNNVRRAVCDMFKDDTKSYEEHNEVLNTSQVALRLLRSIVSRHQDVLPNVQEGVLQMPTEEEVQILHDARMAPTIVIYELMQRLKSNHDRFMACPNNIALIFKKLMALTSEFIGWFDMTQTAGQERGQGKHQTHPWYFLITQTRAAHFACQVADLLQNIFLLLHKPTPFMNALVGYIWFFSSAIGFKSGDRTATILCESDARKSALDLLIFLQLDCPSDVFNRNLVRCLWIDLWLRKFPAMRKLIMRNVSLSSIRLETAKSVDSTGVRRDWTVVNSNNVSKVLCQEVIKQLGRPSAQYQHDNGMSLNLSYCYAEMLENTALHAFTKIGYIFLQNLLEESTACAKIAWVAQVAAERLIVQHDQILQNILSIRFGPEDGLEDILTLIEASCSSTMALNLLNIVQTSVSIGSFPASIEPVVSILKRLSGYSVLQKSQSKDETKSSSPTPSTTFKLQLDADGLYRLAMLNWRLSSSAQVKGTLPDWQCIQTMYWASCLGHPYAQMEIANLWHNIWKTGVPMNFSSVDCRYESSWEQAVYWFTCSATSPDEVSDHSLGQLELLLKDGINRGYSG